jgi:pimeloyl-ACP methyl ester carboxylesterase
MSVQFADLGRLSLAYETFGLPEHPAVMLVMGLGAQMIVWPDEFCHAIADKGYYLVRFDNRDIGQSTKLNEFRPPGLITNMLRLRMGFPVRASYSLYDMAKDLLGLMNYLGIAEAHLVGASMGGMISQIVAAKNYRRVLSLTSIMSSSGGIGSIPPSPHVLMQMLKPSARRTVQSRMEHKVELISRLGGRGMPTDRTIIQSRVTRAMERSRDDESGTRRQTAAILSTGCRQQEVREVRAPTLIIHGALDPLIPLTYGVKTARVIKHSQIEVMQGMGHDLPPAMLIPLAKRIVQHFESTRHPGQKERDAKRPFLY